MLDQLDLDIEQRPKVGRLYSPTAGALAKCMAVGPTHVVVHWLKGGQDRHVIYTREAFATDFHEITRERFEQPDLFPVELAHE
ncbi:MAG: hypothetical protein AB7N70_36340 [Dehalococcoidia bacterium]